LRRAYSLLLFPTCTSFLSFSWLSISYRYDRHRNLHSFPTRRSSDLRRLGYFLIMRGAAMLDSCSDGCRIAVMLQRGIRYCARSADEWGGMNQACDGSGYAHMVAMAAVRGVAHECGFICPADAREFHPDSCSRHTKSRSGGLPSGESRFRYRK